MTLLSDAGNLVAFLRSKGLTLCAAESCTGGMIGSTITSVPGASDVFLGSAVTYSNDSKVRILKVSQITLESYGAVSEQTAKEMAYGSKKVFKGDLAVAVTGIAGPGGGTPEKPVGLVYIAVTDGFIFKVTRNLFEGDRQSVREQTVQKALEMLKEAAEGIK